jgi:hypothetical protein
MKNEGSILLRRHKLAESHHILRGSDKILLLFDGMPYRWLLFEISQGRIFVPSAFFSAICVTKLVTFLNIRRHVSGFFFLFLITARYKMI